LTKLIDQIADQKMDRTVGQWTRQLVRTEDREQTRRWTVDKLINQTADHKMYQTAGQDTGQKADQKMDS
jgi:hypothetical protein